MTPDYNKAAIKAAETLVKYNVRSAPLSPLRILEQMENVIVISFSEISELAGIDRSELTPLFGRNLDAITSIHTENGKQTYIVAYNRLLPFSMEQRALAREMAHITLKHTESNEKNAEEAMCFQHHLLCPRPLIHAVQASGMRVTVDLLANLTGLFDQQLVYIRHLPGTIVPANLNRFVSSQFMPFFLNYFEYYQKVMPKDGSALADLGSYMEGYEE